MSAQVLCVTVTASQEEEEEEEEEEVIWIRIYHMKSPVNWLQDEDVSHRVRRRLI